jgi:peptide/nickel transport system permease protein
MLGGVLITLIVLAALLAPFLAPHDPTEQFREGLTPDGQPIPSTLLTEGSWQFPLGT